MYVIILAAGQSKRFQEAGIDTPKPFLEVEYRGTSAPMIQHVINTIPLKFPEVHIATPPGTEFNVPGVWVSGITETKGPADTALQMMSILGDYDTGKPSSYLILDSDVLNFTNDLERLTEMDCSGVLASWSANPAHSYVDRLGIFTSIEEKKRISEFAVRGAYFIHKSVYTEFIHISRLVVEEEQEPYLSYVFNDMVCPKVALPTSYLPVDWGTPRDLRISGAHIVPVKGET